MYTTKSLAALVLAAGSLAVGGVSWAQPGGGREDQPISAATDKQPETPKVRLVKPEAASTDAELRSALAMLTGSFKAAPAGDQPALRLNTSLITVEGWDNALYFELTRDDAPAVPFRSGVMHLYRRQGGLVLRQCAFEGARTSATFGHMLAGLWAAPETLPVLKPEQLIAIVDLPVRKTESGFAAGTAAAAPTMISGATEFTSALTMTAGGLSIADRGFDATGKQVWGPAPDAATAFSRVEPAAKVEIRDNGLVLIDLVPARDPGRLAGDGSEAVLHYTGWTLEGFEFDSSRRPGREPLKLTLPGQLIAGWNLGIPGVGKGTVRKLVIPGVLGYGERGNPRARIGPNATLVFEVECVWLQLAGEAPADRADPSEVAPKDARKPEGK